MSGACTPLPARRDGRHASTGRCGSKGPRASGAFERSIIQRAQAELTSAKAKIAQDRTFTAKVGAVRNRLGAGPPAGEPDQLTRAQALRAEGSPNRLAGGPPSASEGRDGCRCVKEAPVISPGPGSER